MSLPRNQRPGHTLAVGSLFLAGVLSVSGCAPVAGVGPQQEDPQNPGQPVTFELKRPVLNNIAPTTVALGDEVRVFGKDFIDDKHGQLFLHYDGTYDLGDGSRPAPSVADIPLTYISPGQAKFEFGPNIIFSQTGQDLGTFSGKFQVYSKLTTAAINAEAGDTEISDVQTLQMKAGPSIYIDQLRSIDQNCEPVTKATIGETNMAIGVKTLGMGAATAGEPITFSFTFNSPGLVATFVRNDFYQQWPLVPTVFADTKDNTSSTFQIPITSGTSVVVDPQHYEQVVNVSPPVTIGQQQYNSVKLARLMTGKIEKPGATNMTLVIQATKPDGTTLSRTVNFPVWNQIELQQWNGIETLRQIYEPEAEDLGCTSGGPLGANIQYSVGTSASKSRTVNMNWNINNAISLGLSVGYSFGTSVNVGLPTLGAGINNQVHVDANTSATWSQTFGVDVSQSVSTEEHKNSTISVNVPPNYQIMSYRQASRMERTVGVVYHNACGVSGSVGDAVLTNWAWGFDLPQGPVCRPEPQKLNANVCGAGGGQKDCIN